MVDRGFSTGVPDPRAGSLGHLTQQRAPPSTGSTHPQAQVTSGHTSLWFWDVYLSHGPDHASWSGMVFSVTSVSPLTGNVPEVFSKCEFIREQERIGIWETAGTRREDRKAGGVFNEGSKAATDMSKQIH